MRLPGQFEARRLLLLGLPLLLVAGLILGPLLLTLIVSVFEKKGFWIRPGFTLDSYGLFFAGARVEVLERSFRVALFATAIMLLIAYPIAYAITRRVRAELTRAFLFLFAVPFLVNYIVRTFAWADILSRTGFVNALLLRIGRDRAAPRLAAVLRLRGLSRLGHRLHAVHDLPDLALALGHRPALA